MLKGIAVIIVVMVVIVGIEEEAVFSGEDECRTHVGPGKTGFFGIPDFEYIAFVVLEVPSYFIAQVGSGLAVAYNF